MAEDLNGYFSTVFIREDISSLPVPDAQFQEAKSDYLGQLIVTPQMVAKKIKAMKDNKSPGVDGIPPKLLMKTVEQIRIPLARVFNLSLKERVVPFEWKEANIIPLFKKGSRNKSDNYRPVSLTSVICKLLERLVKDFMVDFLVRHKLLNSSQHGFLKARSYLTNMLCFLEEITKWIDDVAYKYNTNTIQSLVMLYMQAIRSRKDDVLMGSPRLPRLRLYILRPYGQ